MTRVSSCLALKDVDVVGCSVWTDFLIWYSVWQPWFCVLGVGGGNVVIFQEQRYLGCQRQAVLETAEESALQVDTGGPQQPAPGLSFRPSARSSEGILAEWILRPGQFQGDHGALGPDCGDGTSKVTLMAGPGGLSDAFSLALDFLKEKPMQEGVSG